MMIDPINAPLAADATIEEVILSGGDPLSLADDKASFSQEIGDSFKTFGFAMVRDHGLEALPVVLTVAVMPMTYSIANGIGAGFITWVVMRTGVGRAREISPLLWVVAVGFVLYFARGGIESFLGL